MGIKNQETNIVKRTKTFSKIPSGGRLTVRSFARYGRVEFVATKHKSIWWQEGGCEPGTSRLLAVLCYSHMAMLPENETISCSVEPLARCRLHLLGKPGKNVFKLFVFMFFLFCFFFRCMEGGNLTGS